MGTGYYRMLPNIALADVAFRARADSPSSLFSAAARALTDVMVDRRSLRGGTQRTLEISSDSMDRLLYDYLTELIILKDVDSLLFKTFEVTVSRAGTSLKCRMRGEAIDRVRHRLRNDVKAVTMHMFGIKRVAGKRGLEATVVLDI